MSLPLTSAPGSSDPSSHGSSSVPLAEENAFAAFRPSLCGVVFSALAESNGSLQVTATSVLAQLGQQTGEWSAVNPHSAGENVPPIQKVSAPHLRLSGLLLNSDVELAVDHLTRLLLTEEDDAVRSSSARKRLQSCRLPDKT